MILIVGASGQLGGAVARRLLAEGKPVRALGRSPEKLAGLAKMGADIAVGDLRDPRSIARACQGVGAVLAAAHAFDGAGSNTSRAIDLDGNRNLIDAARAAGIGHFVLLSIVGARPDHPVDTFRYKYESERYLRASGLSYTILRGTAFMELWLRIIGDPIVRQGKTTLFGRGINPINFVSVDDMARFALIALQDPSARGQAIDVGGPENITMLRLAATVERVTSRTARKQHIPVPAMRLLSVLTRPFNQSFSRQALSGVMMDTQNMAFDPSETLKRYPMDLTPLEEVARRRYASGAPA